MGYLDHGIPLEMIAQFLYYSYFTTLNGSFFLLLGSVTDPFDVTADIVFLIDSSSGVSLENYKKEKDFVASLAKLLNFGSGKTRVAVILYSDYARQAIRFDVVNNPELLQSVLDGLSLLRGGRRIDRALSSAAQVFGDSRPNVRHIVVLLTAGKHTSESVSPIENAVKSLKTAGVERFVIAIGPDSSRQELKPVVERDQDVIYLPTFDSLGPQIRPIAEHISKGWLYSLIGEVLA